MLGVGLRRILCQHVPRVTPGTRAKNSARSGVTPCPGPAWDGKDYLLLLAMRRRRRCPRNRRSRCSGAAWWTPGGAYIEHARVAEVTGELLPAQPTTTTTELLTTKAASFCPPLIWPTPAVPLSLGPRVPWCARPAHGGSRSGWHAACPSTCSAPPRSRFGGADYELLEPAHHGTLGPSDSQATLLQLGRPALRMSSKHEVAFIFTPHDGPE